MKLADKKTPNKSFGVFPKKFLQDLFLDGVDNLLNENRESRFVVNCKFRKLLSVKLDIEGFQTAMNTLYLSPAARHAALMPGNPEAAEFATAHASVAICVFAGMLHLASFA